MSDWTGSDNPKMDARLEGSQVFSVPANTTKIDYVMFDFDCSFNGIEIGSSTTKVGDSVSLWTEYLAIVLGDGTEIWLRYKKFGKSWNIFKNNITRIVLFPTLPKDGVRLAIKYKNTNAEPVNYAINKFQFVDSEPVNVYLGQEGEDW